jgi:hypothetical protein
VGHLQALRAWFSDQLPLEDQVQKFQAHQQIPAALTQQQAFDSLFS